MIYGGRGAPDLVLREMETMGLALFLTTENGSAVGDKGLVTRALEARLAHPPRQVAAGDGVRPQRDAVGDRQAGVEQNIPCFISLEEQMACGIGVCPGCAVPARSRPYRIRL